MDDGSLDEWHDSPRCIAPTYKSISIKTLGDARNYDETQYMVPTRFTQYLLYKLQVGFNVRSLTCPEPYDATPT